MPIKRVKTEPDPADVLVANEIPRPDDIELPKSTNGVEYITWAEVGKDIKSYKMFFHKREMWSARTRKMKDADQKEVHVTYFTKVANFDMNIILHMRDQKQALRLVQMTNVWGDAVPFDTSSESFSSKMIFCKTVEAYGNYLFTGSDTDLQRLKQKLMDEMGNGTSISVLGWQKKAGFFAFNNCAVNGEVYPYDDNGMVTIGGKVYYVPSANGIYEEDETSFSAQKRVKFIENGITFRQVLESFMRVHGNHTKLAFPWALACAFHDHIFKDRNFFPIYFLYGHPSTGKGQLVRGAMSLFGEPLTLTTITGSSTDKSKIRKMAQFRNMIGGFDEYSIQLPDSGQKMIQGYWDGHGYDRATMDNSVNVSTVPVRCGAVVLGNDYPTVDALVTRCIIDPFLDDKFSPDQKRHYDVLNDMIVKGYSGIMKDVLCHRKAFEKEWLTCWDKAKGDVNSQLGLEPGIVGRMLDNLSVILAVRWFFDQRLDWPFTYQEVLQYAVDCMKRQNLKRDTGGNVAQFWDCIRKCVKDEELVLGEDFRIDGNALIIAWNSCHNAYLSQHRKLYTREGDGKHVMADKLKNSPAFSKLRDRDVRMAGAKVYGFEFKADALGDLCEDLGSDRAKRFRRTKAEKPAEELVPLEEAF